MIHEALNEYLSRQLEVLSLLSPDQHGDKISHLRVAALAALRDLSMIALSPHPESGLERFVRKIRENVEGRPMHYDSDTALSSDAKAGQVVLRHQKQMADDIEQLLTDCDAREYQ